MPNTKTQPTARRTRAAARPLIALALASVFILVARQIEPAGSLAGESGDLGDPIAPAGAPKAFGTGRPSLGTLTGGDYTIEIVPHPDGPRYTVYDRNGEKIADQLPAEDLYRIAPDLDVTGLFAGMSGPLMMAELPEP
ncbi:MAG: hypothetical protein IBJ10_03395 [Phycisphaerales bacterium]|nr:hypothetical protein [Phycisphaerales bacterium]